MGLRHFVHDYALLDHLYQRCCDLVHRELSLGLFSHSLIRIDTLGGITWQAAARKSFVSCTGTQESTRLEWYGIASNTLTLDTIAINLSTTPTSASGITFGVKGADTTTPFDPMAGLPVTAVSSCSNGNSTPTLSGVSTAADTDLVFALFGAYQLTTEIAGTVGGATATLVMAVAGTGDYNEAEYIAAATA